LVTQYDVKLSHAVLVLSLLTFPDADGVTRLVSAAHLKPLRKLPTQLRRLRRVLGMCRQVEAGKVHELDPGDDGVLVGDHSVEEQRVVARLDGTTRAPVLRPLVSSVASSQMQKTLSRFRSHLRRIEKSTARVTKRWWREGQDWFGLLRGHPTPIPGHVSHPGWSAAWSIEEIWPGDPCRCGDLGIPHRHCDACGKAGPDGGERRDVRSIAHVHPFTFERRHAGWACAEHAQTLPTPYPPDWIERFRAAGMFVEKTKVIRLRLPVPSGKAVEISALIDAGPIVVSVRLRVHADGRVEQVAVPKTE